MSKCSRLTSGSSNGARPPDAPLRVTPISLATILHGPPTERPADGKDRPVCQSTKMNSLLFSNGRAALSTPGCSASCASA